MKKSFLLIIFTSIIVIANYKYLNFNAYKENEIDKLYDSFAYNTSDKINDLNVDGNKNESIKMIEIYDGDRKIDLSFASSIYKYNVVVPDNRIEYIKILAELNNGYSFLQGFEPKPVILNYGDNIVELKTISETGDEDTYLINIVRPQGLPTDARLIYLRVNGKEVKITDELEYLVIVDNSVVESDIVAKANKDNVKIKYENIILKENENKLTIELIDENNVSIKYTINIFKVSNTKYDNLEKIDIDGYNFEFNVNKHEYDIEIDNLDDNNIKVLPEGLIYYTIKSPQANENKSLIVRVFNDCETKTYTFHLIKKNDKASDIVEDKNNNYTIYYIFFGMSIIILILSIYYAVVIKKRKKMSI